MSKSKIPANKNYLLILFLMVGSVLGAQTQTTNSIQVVNGPVVESHKTFHKAYAYQKLGLCTEATDLYNQFLQTYDGPQKPEWLAAARHNITLCDQMEQNPRVLASVTQKTTRNSAPSKRNIKKQSRPLNTRPATKSKKQTIVTTKPDRPTKMDLSKAYLVQFVTLSNPDKVFSELEPFGKTITEKVSGKSLYRYYKGPYASKTEAEQALKQIKKAGRSKAFLVALGKRPGIIKDLEDIYK